MRCVFYIELLWLTAVRVSGQSLPTVDLGYEVHQAISFNVCFIITCGSSIGADYPSHLDNTITSATSDMPSLQSVISALLHL